MLRLVDILALAKADIDAELAALPADEAAAQEAGRVFSAANEQTLKAVATAINALLAQVQQAPAVSDAPAPAQPAQPPVAAAPPAAIVRQSAEPTQVADLAIESASTGIVTPVGENRLTEAAVKDGKSLIKVISPGWGSSGYYGAGVLERDAATAWPAGTKMFWDHPADKDSRPERSLRDLAAETLEDARWMGQGPEGPGVYARARVFKAFQPAVDELAPHIGVSIRSSAVIRNGEADGRKGRIVERLVADPLNSIDFVTVPGRGGRIAALFESYAGTTTEGEDTVSDREKELEAALAEANRTIALGRARDVAAEALGKADLPQIAKDRIVKAVVAGATVKEDGTLDEDAVKKACETAVTQERGYIDSLMGRRTVTGLGESQTGADPKPEEARKDLEQQFLALGMSEGAARTAAAGRSR